jgi:NTE family protein
LLGTSIGAINAAMVAVDPTPAVIDDLVRLWATPEMGEVFGDSMPRTPDAPLRHAPEHWFAEGPVLPAVMAAAAVPGVLPPYALNGEHFVDGSTVRPSPVLRAVSLGATDIYVLQVGRVDKPLTPPQRPWEAATVALELGRRARFAEELAQTPPGVRVHVLPPTPPPAITWLSASEVPRRGQHLCCGQGF